MKKSVLIVLTAVFCNYMFAQNTEYLEIMQKTVDLTDSAKTGEEWLSIANTMERIAEKETEEWLPFYYVSHAYLMCGLINGNKKEQSNYYEKALEQIKICETKPGIDSSEVFVMKSFVWQMQISLNPAKLGRTLGPLSDAALKEAFRINPDNPRAYMLRGQNLYHTPPMFGGDKEKAYKDFLTAKEKFESFKAESSLSPRWGYEFTLHMIKGCEESKE